MKIRLENSCRAFIRARAHFRFTTRFREKVSQSTIFFLSFDSTTQRNVTRVVKLSSRQKSRCNMRNKYMYSLVTHCNTKSY